MTDIRKFDANGREFHVLTQAGDDHVVVEQVMEDEDGDELFTDPRVVKASSLYDKPPVEKVNAAIAQAEDKLADIRKEHTRLIGELAQVRTKEAIDRAKRLEALECALDLLDGKLAWAVQHDKRGNIALLDLTANKDKKGRWRIFLCQTIRDDSVTLEWEAQRLCDYDSWDSPVKVIPYATKEEAIDAGIGLLRASECYYDARCRLTELAQSAKALGVELLPATESMWQAQTEATLRETVKRNRGDADRHLADAAESDRRLAEFLATKDPT